MTFGLRFCSYKHYCSSLFRSLLLQLAVLSQSTALFLPPPSSCCLQPWLSFSALLVCPYFCPFTSPHHLSPSISLSATFSPCLPLRHILSPRLPLRHIRCRCVYSRLLLYASYLMSRPDRSDFLADMSMQLEINRKRAQKSVLLVL